MPLTYRQLGKRGRLGNQLWQIASTIGMAAQEGTTARLPRWEYQPFFSVPDEFFVAPEELESAEYRDVSVGLDEHRGYLQEYQLFQPVEEAIQEYFRPSPEAQAAIDGAEWFHAIRRPRLALHVRRGDLLVHHPIHMPLRSLDYYVRAAAEHPDAAIVVFSDSMAWCRENLPAALPGRELYFSDGVPRPSMTEAAYADAPVTDWLDLHLQTLCEHHIISNSSLAWWGAYLSNDPAPIYPSNWFAPKLPWAWHAELMFPPTWRELHDQTQPRPLRLSLRHSWLMRELGKLRLWVRGR